MQQGGVFLCTARTISTTPSPEKSGSFDPSAGFHTYAVEWDPRDSSWYVDGDLTYKRTTATTPWLDDAFSKPFIIRLNMAVGGNWPGSPEAGTAFPADYEVDYVRVYQRD